jgi:hypothetical protein
MRSEIVLDAMISAVVNSQNSCLSMATNNFIVKVGQIRGNVFIRDVTLDQTSQAFLRCKQTVTIDMDSMLGDLRQTLLNQLTTIYDNLQQGVDKLTLIDNLTKAFNISSMNSCFSGPINETLIKIDSVGRNFNMIDYNLAQIATANIKKCIQEGTIRVGEGDKGLLPNYLKSFEDSELFPPDIIAAPPPPCAEYKAEEFKVELIVTVAMGFVIVVLFLALALYKGWNIKSKKI